MASVMRPGQWLHRQFAWLALVAVVVGALAPGLTRLLAEAQGVEWVEICSSTGLKRIPLDIGSRKAPDAPMDGDVHCPYCLLQLHCPVLPSATQAFAIAVRATDRVAISGGGTTILKRFVKEAHHTRGPPAFS